MEKTVQGYEPFREWNTGDLSNVSKSKKKEGRLAASRRVPSWESEQNSVYHDHEIQLEGGVMGELLVRLGGVRTWPPGQSITTNLCLGSIVLVRSGVPQWGGGEGWLTTWRRDVFLRVGRYKETALACARAAADMLPVHRNQIVDPDDPIVIGAQQLSSKFRGGDTVTPPSRHEKGHLQ